ncbi:cation-translocating P-type ATPase [Chloroflexota bacterium]
MYSKRNWHNLETKEVLASLETDHLGLSQEEAQRRLAQFGPNELVETGKTSPWAIFFSQFKSFLIIILLIAIVLSAVLGEVLDAIVISIIVLFACGLGFIQEYRAGRAMEALKQMAAPTASVVRDGSEMEIPAREVVPGDIILLRTGDLTPADARLIEAVNLKMNEAPLTGESTPTDKVTQPLDGEIETGDRKNMVYCGTAAVYGRGTAVVAATGMSTEFGKIAGMLQEVEAPPTPLQISLNRLGRWLAIGALVLCFALAGIGVIRGHEIIEMFIWGIALAVAAVPEALPAVVTIGLAIGLKRMIARHALIRKLPAVETLGSTSVICSDKTGTLTQDQMTVRRLYVNGKFVDVSGVGYEPKGEFHVNSVAVESGQDIHLQTLLQIGSLCNDTILSSVDGIWQVKGDPTEGALVVLAAKAGIEQDEWNRQFPRVAEVPFSSERKRMTTVHQMPQGRVAYSKGAPEAILERCTHIYAEGRERELTVEDRENILSAAQAMAGEALRVLAMAYRSLTDTAVVTEAMEQDMVLVGLVGMIDPPREEVKGALILCQQAGIKAVMITGDHKLTAIAVAKELGLLQQGVTLTGSELDALSEAEFEAIVERIEVYARVSPAHKLRVVETLTKKGYVVAMTGDGVNDAPALKRADIGIAMGITGTDVTKETADMILTDDNFASIVSAVEEGRGVFDNIKKFLMYLLACNLGEVLLMAVAVLFGPLLGLPAGALPLIAIQILYVNLATDGLPAIALSVDPPEPDIMQHPPRPRGQTIFTLPVLRLMVLGGIWTFLLTIGVFVWALKSGRPMLEAQGLCFVTLILIEFVAAFNFRSEKHSLFKIGFFTNRWLLLAVFASLIMSILVIYLPSLQDSFHTYNLSVNDWLIVVVLATTIFPVLEIAKLIGRWRERHRAK